MWPWEHLAFGYVLYSGYTRLRHGHPPEQRPVLALAAATQFADVLDKPLAWTFDVLPTARSLGHSIFFAAAVVGVVALVGRRLGTPGYVPAVAIGYASHLLGDVLYGFVRRGEINVRYLLWPLVRLDPRGTPGLFDRTADLLVEFQGFLASPVGRTYLAAELVLVLAVFVLWAADGWPGARILR